MQVLVHDFWLVEAPIMAIAQCPPQLTIHSWWNDRLLMARHKAGALSLPIVPDGLLVVENRATGKLFPCLVEVDLGSESVVAYSTKRGDFARKIEGYLGYIDRGFQQEFAIPAPPVVLIICDSKRRMNSLREATARLGGKGRFWFATLEQLGANVRHLDHPEGLQGPFWGPSWQTAHEDGLRSLATRCGV